MLRVILIVVLSFIIFSFAITKIIYNMIFKRYDIKTDEVTSDFFKDDDRIYIETEDGKITAYLTDAADFADNDTLLLIVPGLHAVSEDYALVGEYFTGKGYDVAVFDPIGSGESEGKSYKTFSQITKDTVNVLNYLENNYRYDKICLFGHSRGAYGAITAADDKVDAIVSVSGYNSAMDAIMAEPVQYVGNLAFGNYPFLWAYQVMLCGVDAVNANCYKIAFEMDVPVLIIQGKDDKSCRYDRFSLYNEVCEQAGKVGAEAGGSSVMSYDIDTDGDEDFALMLRSEEGSNGHTDLMYDGEEIDTGLFDAINDFYLGYVE